MHVIARIFMIAVSSSLLVLAPAFAAEDPVASQESGEITAAFESLKSYTFERKAEFLHWAEARSRELDRQIDALQAKIKESGGKAGKELRSAEKDLQRERRELAKRMTTIRQSSADAWEDAKWGVSAAFEKIEQAYQRAASRFQEKPEPPP